MKKYITLKCKGCEKDFNYLRNTYVKETNSRGRTEFYCNQKCKAIHTGTSIKCICQECHKEFYWSKYAVEKQNKGHFCGKECYLLNHGKHIDKENGIKINGRFHFPVTCKNCEKEFHKDINKIKMRPNHFCSRKCGNDYNLINRQSKHIRRSKAENILIEILEREFPELKIESNNRKLIYNTSLEIDILIPEIKLAIELNGPVHYLPIYGQDKLDEVKRRDEIKVDSLSTLNYNLVVINISMLQGEKKTRKFLEQYFTDRLFTIITDLTK